MNLKIDGCWIHSYDGKIEKITRENTGGKIFYCDYINDLNPL